jgi:hypothetical protein
MADDFIKIQIDNDRISIIANDMYHLHHLLKFKPDSSE